MANRVHATRRAVLFGAGAVLAASSAKAQTGFVSRPIKMIVGYAPASGADVVARLIGSKLAETSGQSVIVENRPGAGGAVATQEFVRAPADGQSLLMAAMPQMIISPVISTNLTYDAIRDFEPVAQIVQADLVLITNPAKVPSSDFKTFVDWARNQPETYFGTPGSGTVGHFLATMLAESVKAKIQPVHFKATGDSVNTLLGGDIHALFVTYTVAEALEKAGKVKALAVTSTKRSRHFPDAPTMRELGHPELEVGSWYGVFAPAKTPADILDRLSADLVRIALMPDISSKLDDAGMTLTAMGRGTFAKSLREDIAVWQKAIKATGFKSQD